MCGGGGGGGVSGEGWGAGATSTTPNFDLYKCSVKRGNEGKCSVK